MIFIKNIYKSNFKGAKHSETCISIRKHVCLFIYLLIRLFKLIP